MGFFSRAKDVGGVIFNFRVTRWMALDQIKDGARTLIDTGKNVFKPQQAERKETFEEALIRLNLTEEDLKQRETEFKRLMLIYLGFASLMFCYSVWLAYAKHSLPGFFVAFALTIYILTLAFRYHFWIFQIRNKKLGCSLRDWFLDKN